MSRPGLIGLGTLGEPVARHLLAANPELVVWNRSPEPAARLGEAGATVALDPVALAESCDTIFLVLSTEQAADEVLQRDEHGTIGLDIEGRTIVQLATVSPDHSEALEVAVKAAGGAYVEAPVSGSRVPAERGELVAMIAGSHAAKARVLPLFDPFTAKVIDCGDVPGGIAMKLASNVMLVPLMLGIVESMAFAKRAGLDLAVFGEMLKSGQMASPILKVKVDKILSGDWSPQAQMDNVVTSGGDAVALAHRLGMADTLLERALAYVDAACEEGLDKEDVVAVFKLLVHESPMHD
ncbi:NAD(P)-dependent oxidoreductase [Sphingomicrobium nitratireducens]|uniref:NAD(P)-dependent oxidoreductase n=1 Tax=Sphingomicrobium nitratireducens TaxID=2964666 RepID=UPI00223FBC30